MPHASGSVVPRRRRKALGALAASLPLFLLAGMLVAPGMASAGIVFGPDLVVTISDTPDPVAPGGTVTYTVLVANVGNADSYSTNVNFNTDGRLDRERRRRRKATDARGRAPSVSCDLGYIPVERSALVRRRPRRWRSTRQTVTIVVAAPDEPGIASEHGDRRTPSEQNRPEPGRQR